MTAFLQAVLAALIVLAPVYQPPTSDPRPAIEGAPHLSFLLPECRIELTGGTHWHRLWLNCGSGPHLISEPSSFTWHVDIARPEQALELVRLFSSTEACERFPAATWLEVTSAAKKDWIELDKPTFQKFCPVPRAHEILEAGAAMKLFSVKRCLLKVDDGHLYVVEEHVRGNGETSVIDEKIVMRNAAKGIGDCNPPGAPAVTH